MQSALSDGFYLEIKGQLMARYALQDISLVQVQIRSNATRRGNRIELNLLQRI